MKVLFVCTQNVFRSFSAEKLLTTYLLKKKNSNIIVDSAGTEAYPDTPYSYTLEALQKLGVKNLDHRQKSLCQLLVNRQNIIICMTLRHQEILLSKFSKKSILFNEIAFDSKTNLADDLETNTNYRNLANFVVATVQKISDGIPAIYEKLLQANKQSASS